MNTITKIIVIAVVLLIGASLAWSSFMNPEASEQHIKDEIAKANYCEVASDCQLVPSECPFGCYVHVNKNEAVRISELLEGYQSNCIYSCIEFKGVDCVNNRCELLQ